MGLLDGLCKIKATTASPRTTLKKIGKFRWYAVRQNFPGSSAGINLSGIGRFIAAKFESSDIPGDFSFLAAR